jgi:parallel beta-helix repeat protein
VTGFTVRGFVRDGIFVFGGRATVVQGNALVDNGEYGVFANASNGTVIANNTAAGSDEAGIYVGDSPRAGASVRGNEVYDNGFGVFLRSASVGLVQNNRLHDNCAGIFVLAGPVPPSLWMISGNQVNHNNRVCPPGHGPPPMSGVGILVEAGFRNTIQGNTVNDNAPGGPTIASGGIVLSHGASGNSITGNRAHRNVPVDLADDSGSPNRFSGNVCVTSRPQGLCQLR